MDDIVMADAGAIAADPRFAQLVAARTWLRWGLSALVLVMFFGLIALMSFSRSVLAMHVAVVGIPLGLVLAFAMFAGIVAVTAVYVRLSGKYFDAMAQDIRIEFGR